MQRGLSLGLFGLFGRSQELRDFDKALRALIKEEDATPKPESQTYRAAAEIIAYCMVGADGFGAANDAALAAEVERRMEAALASGASLDARLVLLTLHAKVIQPSVVELFQLKSDAE